MGLTVRVWVQQKIQKMHICGAGVREVDSNCAQSVQVWQNWLHTNTLKITKQEEWNNCAGGENWKQLSKQGLLTKEDTSLKMALALDCWRIVQYLYWYTPNFQMTFQQTWFINKLDFYHLLLLNNQAECVKQLSAYELP